MSLFLISNCKALISTNILPILQLLLVVIVPFFGTAKQTVI